jgi:PAS domain S-box-containing protein
MENNDQQEQKRLNSLYQLNLVYTPKEARFDRISSMAATLFNAPFAGMGMVDKDKVWFKSLYGTNLTEVERKRSLVNKSLEQGGVFVVEDASLSPEFNGYSLVANDPHVKFFAGVSLLTPDNFPVAVFFIADSNPRNLDDRQKQLLSDIGKWAQLEMIRNIAVFKVYEEQRKTQEELNTRNRELEEEKARSTAMLENIGDGVIGINDKGEIIFSNRHVEVLTGFNSDEIEGKLLIRVLKMVDENDNEIIVHERPIRNALFSKKKVASSKYYYVRKDGTKFPAAITATPVIVYDQIIGGVNVFRDITKEKQIDRMKTEFISLASHQLRTPLSAMKWFSEILLDGDAGQLNKEQREMMNNIYQSNERMIELVNTLLNISRIESGRIIIDPKPTNLKKLVDEVIVEVKPKLTKKKQHLAISVHGKLPLINIDPKLVRHVYMNLLTNAIKYTQDGGDIVVMISKTDKEIISQVSDNGYGIPKDQQSKVFKKFFRAENIVKIETEGTGLGLYLTKSIVDSSGGRIWFDSDEGQGTTFWFALPLSGSVQKKGEVSID